MSSQLLRRRIVDLLSTPVITQINFNLGSFRIDYYGFMRVKSELVAGYVGTGIDVIVDKLPANAEAAYKPDKRTYVFPNEFYGITPFQRIIVVHETVHALIHLRDNPHLFVDTGPKLPLYPTQPENEAAAFVAAALFSIYAYNGAGYPSLHPVYGKALAIATSIKDKPGAIVPAADAVSLEIAIVNDPAYNYSLWRPLSPD